MDGQTDGRMGSNKVSVFSFIGAPEHSHIRLEIVTQKLQALETLWKLKTRGPSAISTYNGRGE